MISPVNAHPCTHHPVWEAEQIEGVCGSDVCIVLIAVVNQINNDVGLYSKVNTFYKSYSI